MDKRKIIIDTDPGIDDAVALAIALFDETVEVSLITTVAGNVSVEKTTKNLLKLLKFYNKDIPVAKGADRPLIREARDASGVHGETGMGGYEFPEEDTSLLLKDDAVDAMYNTLVKNGKTTLVPIGPLTNIAMMLRKYPDAGQYIDEIVLMGGSASRGNFGVYSEFNIGYDPEAAHIVFDSGIPFTMVGLDVGLKALVYPEDSEKLKDMNKVGNMFYHLFKQYRGGSFMTGLKMYDASAIAYLLKPEMFETVETHVSVELHGEYTAGATLVDLRGYLNKPNNAKVTLDIDPEAFKEWFMEAISKCDVV
ncbi:ribonucleoside hydrolase RihC [Erysipelothrix sp. HDW6C]|uniref:ribonucleoside hydrolase RihC n=1 Tax=Erysipelothrix sp. HDW6C TaxID=2714930 RepID=UPI00140D2F21|nr:ribonucleoside hydrolase RihC [Erysipelothrix sp. HDW6C]QIK70417.1 ribonucleoside hydrolase RihC [Erysipelothrix sp. HDW6C]